MVVWKTDITRIKAAIWLDGLQQPSVWTGILSEDILVYASWEPFISQFACLNGKWTYLYTFAQLLSRRKMPYCFKLASHHALGLAIAAWPYRTGASAASISRSSLPTYLWHQRVISNEPSVALYKQSNGHFRDLTSQLRPGRHVSGSEVFEMERALPLRPGTDSWRSSHILTNTARSESVRRTGHISCHCTLREQKEGGHNIYHQESNYCYPTIGRVFLNFNWVSNWYLVS